MSETIYADDIDEGGDKVPLLISDLRVHDGKGLPPDGDDRIHKPDIISATDEEILAFAVSKDRVSGLSDKHAAEARQLIAAECHYLLARPAELHYTQGPLRWEAISGDWRYTRGRHQRHGDCSSTQSQLVRVALRHFKITRDLVNGEHWLGGYTGTIIMHGKPVRHLENLRIGDSILYGESESETEHVATSLGGRLVFSHGSDRGPFLLDIDYRPDRVAMRRHI